MARDVLVIGGSGFLGRRITAAFADQGDHVAVLSRGLRPLEGLTEVELLQGDRRDSASLRQAAGNRSFDVVIDNIAYDGTDVLTLFEVFRGRIGHYLQTSSAAVYADRYVRRPLREEEADLRIRVPTEAPNPFHSRLGHGYANGKRYAEQVARASGVPWTILRPPVVLGPDDRTLRVWWFVQRLLDGGPIVIPDWGPGRIFHLAWTVDIARAFCAAAGNPAAFGRAYNVAQSEIYTAESWIEAAAKILGLQPRYAHLDEAAVAEVGLAGYLLPVAGRPFGHVLLDTSALAHELGFQPSAEAVWLQDTLLGCAANPPAIHSGGYERRATEVSVALRLLERPSEVAGLPCSASGGERAAKPGDDLAGEQLH
jgi:nucleoside-diphosphate-sugar epimerase